MERLIKFKAWLKNEKKMVLLHTMFDYEIGTGFILIDNKVAYVRTIDRGKNFRILDYPEAIIIQYTGLSDNKGKEVYEGDILSNKEGTQEIIYSEFRYNCGCCNRVWGYSLKGTQKIEEAFTIIGNIYENPELLNNTYN